MEKYLETFFKILIQMQDLKNQLNSQKKKKKRGIISIIHQWLNG